MTCSPLMARATVRLNPAYAHLHFIVCAVAQKMAARRGSVTETRVEWIKPEIVNNCEACQASFGIFRRKHHCRYCGHVFCDSCTPSQMKLPPQFGYTEPQVDRCPAACMFAFFARKSEPCFGSACATHAYRRYRLQALVASTSST